VGGAAGGGTSLMAASAAVRSHMYASHSCMGE
jgi:hypothetical protein